MSASTVRLAAEADFQDWRQAARRLLAAEAAPENVVWVVGEADDLFAGAPTDAAPTGFTAPRAFVELAEQAALHREPGRFALLYRLLWRLRSCPEIARDASDPDMNRVEALARAVRRDKHKMTAFVRFREIATEDGARFVAWYEPDHYIVRTIAPFFVDRFGSMDWSILTPDLCAHWHKRTLTFTSGAMKSQAPAEDAREEDWRIYYASIFNPARLKLDAMRREMPVKRWRNLPEAALIPELTRSAQKRTDAMVEAAPRASPKAEALAYGAAARVIDESVQAVAAREREPATIDEIAAALDGCRACPLWAGATQGVPGEGPADAAMVLVGEQPGDQEDLARRPFVGPAGQVLDRALREAGVDRAQVFVTNAVKHFKNEPRGKRRLHKKPTAGKVDRCRWWVEREIAMVRPKLVVALGATAALSVLGHTGPLHAVRGRELIARDGSRAFATVHPSFLLRLPDEDAKAREYRLFVEDLARARSLAGL